MRSACSRNSGVEGGETTCEVWQVVQIGPPVSCLSSALPWTLALKMSSTSTWHAPQVSGTLSRLILESGSVWGRMSWTPWQSLQLGATTRPSTSSALPWIESMKSMTAFS